MALTAFLVLAFVGSSLLVLSNWLEHKPTLPAILGLSASIIAMLFFTLSISTETTLLGMIRLGGLTSLAGIALTMIAALTIMGILANPHKYQAGLAEIYAFILYTALGGVLMVAANNILLLYVAIELSSYSTYILVGYHRHNKLTIEATTKYFILGALASAFLLYGFSLLFGAGQSIYFDELAANLVTASNLPALLSPAIALILVGFGFKLALVPFHAWTPDAYQGAPTMVAALLSAGPKVAAIIALGSFVTQVFVIEEANQLWQKAFMILAIVTMTVGNLQALKQSNLKRLLGYSSIAQLGTITVGLASGTLQGFSAVVLYSISYAIANIGAFTAISALGDAGVKEEIDEYKGLGQRNWLIAFLLSIFLLSLAGIPLLAGFMGKLFVFKSAIEAKLVILTFIAVANTLLAYFYYFKVIIKMWLYTTTDKPMPTSIHPMATAALIIGVLGIFVIGVLPMPFLSGITKALLTHFG